MYARSPRMDTLQVPSTRHQIKIQPMDSRSASIEVPFPISDDDEEIGLGYQNTLVIKKKFELFLVMRMFLNDLKHD